MFIQRQHEESAITYIYQVSFHEIIQKTDSRNVYIKKIY